MHSQLPGIQKSIIVQGVPTSFFSEIIKSQNFEIFCQKIREIEGTYALLCSNTNKLSRIFSNLRILTFLCQKIREIEGRFALLC